MEQPLPGAEPASWASPADGKHHHHHHSIKKTIILLFSLASVRCLCFCLTRSSLPQSTSLSLYFSRPCPAEEGQ